MVVNSTNINKTDNRPSSELNSPNTKRHMTLEIQILAWDFVNNDKNFIRQYQFHYMSTNEHDKVL